MIPKIIHQIWFQGWDSFPDKYASNVQSVIDKNPDWVHVKWDDDKIKCELVKLGQAYLDKYNSFGLLHQKVDFARYALLYIYGGVSVDTDVVALKSFNETPNLNSSDLITSYQPHRKVINNATILASKNNLILLDVLDKINNKPCSQFNTEYNCIQETTGPYSFNKLLTPYKSEITILDNSYLEPCAGVDQYCKTKENSILDHRHELSWLSKPQQIAVGFFYEAKQNKVQLIVAGVIIVVLIVALIRSK